MIAEKLQVGTQRTLKYASLVTLTVQNAALNLTMRMARTQKDLFISSTAVIMAEVIKLVTCLVMVRVDEGSFQSWRSALHRTVVLQPLDTLKVCANISVVISVSVANVKRIHDYVFPRPNGQDKRLDRSSFLITNAI